MQCDHWALFRNRWGYLNSFHSRLKWTGPILQTLKTLKTWASRTDGCVISERTPLIRTPSYVMFPERLEMAPEQWRMKRGTLPFFLKPKGGSPMVPWGWATGAILPPLWDPVISRGALEMTGRCERVCLFSYVTPTRAPCGLAGLLRWEVGDAGDLGADLPLTPSPLVESSFRRTTTPDLHPWTGEISEDRRSVSSLCLHCVWTI